MEHAPDPQQVLLGQPEALADRGHLLGPARVHRRRRRLGDHADPVAVDVEALARVVRDDLRRHDHAVGALDRQVAQLEAHTGAQVLGAALEIDQVVQRHDSRARRAQRRAVEPRGVEHVAATRAVGLGDDAAGLGGFAQRVEQAADVATDPAWIPLRAAVERHPHRVHPSLSAPSRRCPPERALRLTLARIPAVQG
jgi:hypothetical protein